MMFTENMNEIYGILRINILNITKTITRTREVTTSPIPPPLLSGGYQFLHVGLGA